MLLCSRFCYIKTQRSNFPICDLRKEKTIVSEKTCGKPGEFATQNILSNHPSLFQGQLWGSHYPMSYQSWGNAYYGAGSFQTHFSRDIFTQAGTITCHKERNHIENAVNKSRSQLQPLADKAYTCTIMLLENLAYPQWISVNYSAKLQMAFVCSDHVLNQQTKGQNSSYRSHLSNLECPEMNGFLSSKFCYSIVWCISFTVLCRNHVFLTSGNITTFKFIFVATSDRITPILSISPNNGSQILHFTYTRYYSIFHFKKQIFPLKKSVSSVLRGYVIYKIKTAVMEWNRTFGNMFHCKRTKLHISSLLVLDGKSDCGKMDDSDEVDTSFHKSKCNFKCATNEAGLPIVYKREDHLCKSLSGSENITKTHTTNAINPFQCSNTNTIQDRLVDDLVSDCGSSADDEEAYKHLLLYGAFVPCPKHTQLHCEPGHPRCYNMSEICVYRLGDQGQLVPCRTGGHIENCRQFECNKKYKCPGFYCVPFGYLCNGKWDCPRGEDESYLLLCREVTRCEQMFQCRNSDQCIHIDDVCDIFNDCPLFDDEMMCDLKKQNCPSHCSCLNYAMSCHEEGIFFKSFLLCFAPFRSLQICNSSLTPITLLSKWTELENLDLSRNRLEQICGYLTTNKKLVFAKICHNSFENLNHSCFSNLPNLKVIKLNSNNIQHIKTKSFVNLSAVQKIDFSSNDLLCVKTSAFVNLPDVKSITIQSTFIKELAEDSFTNVKLVTLETANYHFCCIKPEETLCTADIPWHISCSDLFPDLAMVLTLSLFCSFSLAANQACLVLMFAKNGRKSKKRPFKVMVSFVNVSDLLCGVYLLILLGAHGFYSGNFMINEKHWRQSLPCFTVSFLSVIYGLLSPFFLVILSVSRLMVVLYPFNSKFKQTRFVAKVLIFSGIATAVVSLSLLTFSWSLHSEVKSTLCLSLIDPAKSDLLVAITTFVISIFQFISSIVICTIYLFISCSVSKTQTLHSKTVQKQNRKNQNLTMILQLVVVTASNILCWIPFDIIYILSLFLLRYPVEMVIWTTIAVTPINSVVNPLVFIATSINLLFEKGHQMKVLTVTQAAHSSRTQKQTFVLEGSAQD